VKWSVDHCSSGLSFSAFTASWVTYGHMTGKVLKSSLPEKNRGRKQKEKG